MLGGTVAGMALGTVAGMALGDRSWNAFRTVAGIAEQFWRGWGVLTGFDAFKGSLKV